MSSLFSKLKAMVNASVRGPRRYQKEPDRPAETEEVPTALPEVTDATPHRTKLPQVTEAPQVEQASTPATLPTRELPGSRIEQPRKEKGQADVIEEERVIDLLKGKQQQR